LAKRVATELQHFRSISAPDYAASSALPIDACIAKREAVRMRQKIEYLFEAVEANAACAVFSITASFALTGCLHLLWS
jgi:hypothetical protein